ncbi:MAG: hypothetical protein ACYSQY_01165 [Planctomycetota bacterium]|jgi:ribose 5-phosphate isomerase RpiB
MKVAVANDHRGHAAIEQIKAIISQLGLECVDCSTPSGQPVCLWNRHWDVDGG